MLSISVSLVAMLFVAGVQTSDDYVKEIFEECEKTKSQYYCAKYNFLKFINNFDYEWTNNSVVNFIKIPYASKTTTTTARYQQDDSEFQKFLKFLMRKMVVFLSSHGLAFIMPPGVQFTSGRNLDDDSSVFSKNAEIGFLHELVWKDKLKLKKISKILLIKLLKIKIMLAMTFFVILIVLKILLMAALVYPVIYHNLQASCEKPYYGWFG